MKDESRLRMRTTGLALITGAALLLSGCGGASSRTQPTLTVANTQTTLQVTTTVDVIATTSTPPTSTTIAAVAPTTLVPDQVFKCKALTPSPDGYPIEPCQEGFHVSEIQDALSFYGFTVDVDGQYGPGTATAVGRFQQTHGLPVTFVVDAATWKALFTEAPIRGEDLDGNGVVDPWEIPYD